MALSSFDSLINGRKVVLYTDNKGRFVCAVFILILFLCEIEGAEGSMKKGSARAFDHNELIHEIWSLAMISSVALWTERVPSKYNVADSPSRFEWQILDDLGP